ncbi:SET domain-containing protein SmydA-8-like [Pectinophora gossypiella]|uniref:SET domain-containing protein SmydA-8-like n=1 Tax=Pectinophora gossypiella TaxID=13191 RepID=UPI00214E12DC|nr:SET domain-containing protein SmydA-8-like [Pectinophora gossypiella]
MGEACHYDVLQNEKFGRYLVANKDLESAELIFTDKPFAVGPKPDTPPLCLSCYCPVDNTLCSKCGWPVCGAECEAAPAHAPECTVFAAAKVRYQSPSDWTAASPQLDCITPLRLLLAKEQDPDTWKRDLEPMEAHTEARRQRPTWAADQVNVVDFLIDHCKLGARFDKELVQRVCGILEVNSVEIPSRGGYSVRAIYPRLAIAAHSCVPNIVHTILHNDCQVQVRAAVPIKSGEPLHLCYTYALSPTLVRREYLMESKFFNCECPRCADPTELGTHLSTLKCQKCDNGIIISSNPLDNEATWKCTEKKCEFKTSSAAMRKMLAVVQAEVDQLDALEGAQAIEVREATLNKYKSVFHPRHAILLGVKQALAQLYGRVEGYSLDELPDLVLERKAEFCRLVLSALDVIMPGESRMRGMMLYELHAPIMFLARSEYSAGLIDQDKLKERLQEPIKLLEVSAKILTREDPQSPEGITGQIALQSMEQLKASLECL